jgi:hypothetical protein
VLVGLITAAAGAAALGVTILLTRRFFRQEFAILRQSRR